jgi:hypothetical protein
MKKYCFITTSYCSGCDEPSKEFVINHFNLNSDINSVFVNFSSEFSPNDYSKIPFIGATKRRDLAYGKIFKLYDFLVANIENKFEYVCHFDFSDTYFCRSATEMMDKFIHSSQDFLICAEKPCWPYYDTVINWGQPKTSLINDDSKIANFLNSGVLISKTSVLLEHLKKLKDLCLTSNIDFWDDQGVWQYYYNFIDNNLNVDFNSEYTICTAFLKEEDFIIRDKTIFVNNELKSKPYIIHDNSSFSANLIYKYKLLI